MAFQYINPGRIDLFDIISDGIQQGNDSRLIESRTSGDYFYAVNANKNKIKIEPNNEYWAAFYWYPSASMYRSMSVWLFAIYNTKKNAGVYLKRESTNSSSPITLSLKDTNDSLLATVPREFSLKKGTHIELYVKNDLVAGNIKFWADGELLLNYTGNIDAGEGFDETYFRGGDNADTQDCISDLAIQNTGRIGDLRVCPLPQTLEVDEVQWDTCLVPSGYTCRQWDRDVRDSRTYILTKSPILVSGKLVSFEMLACNHEIVAKLCVFRLNDNKTTYRAVESADDFIIPVRVARQAARRFTLQKPIDVLAGDLIGVYIYGDTVYINSYLSAYQDTKIGNYVVFEADITADADITMPNPSTNNICPGICVFITPNVFTEGVAALNSIDESDSKLKGLGEITVAEPEKTLLYKINTRGITIGAVETIMLSIDDASYSGNSACKSIAGIVKQDSKVYETAIQPLTTQSKSYRLEGLGINPLTSEKWKVSDLDDIRIGIKSKP